MRPPSSLSGISADSRNRLQPGDLFFACQGATSGMASTSVEQAIEAAGAAAIVDGTRTGSPVEAAVPMIAV